MIEDEPSQDVRRPRPSRLPSPEIVGSGFAVVVSVMILAAALSPGDGTPVVDPTPSRAPAMSRQPGQPTPTPPVDPGAVEVLRQLNGRLLDYSVELQREIDRTTFRTAEVNFIIRRVSNTVDFAIKTVPELEGALGEDEVGGQLSLAYRGISATALETLGASKNTNPRAYQVGAGILVAAIADLPALQEELEALLATPPSPSPSVAPSASPSPSPSPPPSVAPSPSPATATPRQTTGAASQEPSPAPGELIENGGFEQGVMEPWRLLVQQPADAVPAADDADPAAGGLSARIDVTSPGLAYSAIALRQSGVRLEPGRNYIVTLRVRSEGPRDIRVRIVSEQGGSLMTRKVPVTPDWNLHRLEFQAPFGTSTAVFEILLGRSNITTWVDSISVRPR